MRDKGFWFNVRRRMIDRAERNAKRDLAACKEWRKEHKMHVYGSSPYKPELVDKMVAAGAIGRGPDPADKQKYAEWLAAYDKQHESEAWGNDISVAKRLAITGTHLAIRGEEIAQALHEYCFTPEKELRPHYERLAYLAVHAIDDLQDTRKRLDASYKKADEGSARWILHDLENMTWFQELFDELDGITGAAKS